MIWSFTRTTTSSTTVPFGVIAAGVGSVGVAAGWAPNGLWYRGAPVAWPHATPATIAVPIPPATAPRATSRANEAHILLEVQKIVVKFALSLISGGLASQGSPPPPVGLTARFCR